MPESFSLKQSATSVKVAPVRIPAIEIESHVPCYTNESLQLQRGKSVDTTLSESTHYVEIQKTKKETYIHAGSDKNCAIAVENRRT